MTTEPGDVNKFCKVWGMSFALQKINPSCSAASSTSARGKSLEFPFKPVTTKAEKYAELVRFDQCKLKRQKAHFKNALKTTEGLDKVAKQLERVSTLQTLIIIRTITCT